MEAEPWRATVEQALALPVPEGQRSVEVFSHETLAVKYGILNEQEANYER
jgi:hypothetical protein